MASLQDLTISVVSHAHGQLLDELLDDLLRAGAIGQSRVVVTLNVKDPAFPADKWCRVPTIEWIRNPMPKGFGANHNQALIGARTEWVLILNPDIRMPDKVLTELLADLPDASAAGIVAPRIVSPSGRLEDSVRRNLSPVSLLVRTWRRLRGRSLHEAISKDAPADWFAGMFLLLPSHVFAAVGGFDERYFLYCEDFDLCMRVSLLGKSLLLDERHVVVHNAQRTSHRRLRYLRWHLISLTKLWCSPAYWVYTFRRRTQQIGGVVRLPPDPEREKAWTLPAS